MHVAAVQLRPIAASPVPLCQRDLFDRYWQDRESMAKQVTESDFANAVKLAAAGRRDRQGCVVENESSTSRYCCQCCLAEVTYDGIAAWDG